MIAMTPACGSIGGLNGLSSRFLAEFCTRELSNEREGATTGHEYQRGTGRLTHPFDLLAIQWE